MTGVCRSADAMLTGYLLSQAAAEDNWINWRSILADVKDPVAVFVGLANVAGMLREELATEKGISLATLDEAFIGSLLVEGALS